MSEAISESAFEQLADRTLSRLVEALADAEEDFEVDLSSGVLTIKFEDGKRYVVNSHRAARQIWMAAESTAWHFDWNGSNWISTKTQEELWDLVDRTVSKKLGHKLAPPLTSSVAS
jgi:iron-sulfur cluster assembly protein CyaY